MNPNRYTVGVECVLLERSDVESHASIVLGRKLTCGSGSIENWVLALPNQQPLPQSLQTMAQPDDELKVGEIFEIDAALLNDNPNLEAFPDNTWLVVKLVCLLSPGQMRVKFGNATFSATYNKPWVRPRTAFRPSSERILRDMPDGRSITWLHSITGGGKALYTGMFAGREETVKGHLWVFHFAGQAETFSDEVVFECCLDNLARWQ